MAISSFKETAPGRGTAGAAGGSRRRRLQLCALMKWGVNEAERRGGLFQTAGWGRGGRRARLFHSLWMQELTGSASEGLEKRDKRQKGAGRGPREVKQWRRTGRGPAPKPASPQRALWPFLGSYLCSASNCLTACQKLIREHSRPRDKPCVDSCPCFPHRPPLSCFAMLAWETITSPRLQTGVQ